MNSTDKKIHYSKKQKNLYFTLPILLLSACTFEKNNDKQHTSTFKKNETCLKELTDITKQNFVLDRLPKHTLQFQVFAKNENEERIQIQGRVSEELHPIGQLKVDKAQHAMFNSTFDEMNLIQVKLNQHPNFIESCF